MIVISDIDDYVGFSRRLPPISWSSLFVTLCLGLYGQTAASAQASTGDRAVLNANGSPTVAERNVTFDRTSMQSTTITPQSPARTGIAITRYATYWDGDSVCVLAGPDQGDAASVAPPVGPARDDAIVVCSSGHSAEKETDRPSSNGMIPSDGSVTIDGTSDSVDAAGTHDSVNLGGIGGRSR